MKKKFIFAVLVILAFGLSIGCAKDAIAYESPVDVTIKNESSNPISIRIIESQLTLYSDSSFSKDVVQALSDQIDLPAKTNSFITIDLGSCFDSDWIGFEYETYGNDWSYSGFNIFNTIKSIKNSGKCEIIITNQVMMGLPAYEF